MKQSRIGLIKAAIESTAEVQVKEVTDGETTQTPSDQETSDVVADTAPPEEAAGGNQDEVPPAATDTVPETEPAEVVEELAEAAAETTPPVQSDSAPEVEADVEEEGPLDPDAPELEAGEVDMIELFQDVHDLNNGERDLGSNSTDLKKACVAVDELEDLVECAESTKAVDADTDAGRAVLELAVEHIYDKLGIDNPAIALEDGAGLGASVKEKVNSIREQIVRLLRTIMEAVKRAYDQVQQYLKRVFEVSARIEKSAVAVRARARKLDSKSEVQGNIENERLKRAIAASKGATFVECFENMFELVEHAYQSAESGHIDYLNTIIDDFIKGKDIERLRDDFPRVLRRSLAMHFTHNPDDQEFVISGSSEDVNVLTSDLLPGSHVGVLCLPKTVADISDFEYTIQLAVDGEQDPNLTDLPVLNKEELLWMTEIIIKTTSIIRKFERDVRANGSLVSKLSSAIQNLESKVDIELTPADRQFLRAISAIAPALARGIHERTFAFAVSTTANALRYAELCIKQLQSKEPAKN